MRNVARSLAILLCGFTLILSLGGCFVQENTSGLTRREQRIYEIRKSMLLHFYDKYGRIKYDVIQIELSGFNHGYDLLILDTPDKDGTSRITNIRRYKEKNGTYTFEDDYYGEIILPKIESLILDDVKRYFGEAKVFTGISKIFPNEYVSVNQLDQAIEESLIDTLFVVVFVNDSRKNEEEFAAYAMRFMDDITHHGLQCVYRIFNVTEREDFNNCTGETWSDVARTSGLLEIRLPMGEKYRWKAQGASVRE